MKKKEEFVEICGGEVYTPESLKDILKEGKKQK